MDPQNVESVEYIFRVYCLWCQWYVVASLMNKSPSHQLCVITFLHSYSVVDGLGFNRSSTQEPHQNQCSSPIGSMDSIVVVESENGDRHDFTTLQVSFFSSQIEILMLYVIRCL